jgi:hypothetical protein
MLTTRNKGNESCNTSIIDGVPQPSRKKRIECTAFQCSHFDYPKTESILEMVFDYDFSDSSAFRIIETIPVKNIIQEKWQKLRYLYFLWGFCHILVTLCLTAGIVIRSNIYASITWNQIENTKRKHTYPMLWSVYRIAFGRRTFAISSEITNKQ